MAKEFALAIVAPDKSLVEVNITSVVLPGMDGYFGVMADHIPLVAGLRPGLLEYSDIDGQRHFVYVGGGFAEVTANRVTILADEAEIASAIDKSRAEGALEMARRALRGEPTELTREEAAQEMERALHRIRAARVSK